MRDELKVSESWLAREWECVHCGMVQEYYDSGIFNNGRPVLRCSDCKQDSVVDVDD